MGVCLPPVIVASWSDYQNPPVNEGGLATLIQSDLIGAEALAIAEEPGGVRMTHLVVSTSHQVGSGMRSLIGPKPSVLPGDPVEGAR
jgi:hypothetical protein